MLFSSLNFLLIFLPLLFISYFAIPKRFVAARRYVLMAFSFIFYACGEFVYFFAILACVFVTWAVSSGIAKKSKLHFAIAMAVNLVPLLIFKYLNFIITNINLIPGLNIPMVDLVMPIGISFYTFQMLTYIIDLYRGEVKRQKNFGYLALYIFLFPQLIAGPIVRYQDIEIDIGQCKENWESVKVGAGRFIKGLAKKMIIANQVCYICDSITMSDMATKTVRDISEISTPMMWLAVLAYAIQIYFDFSGYSDMAIGLGKMFGFDFLENFNLPYTSTSVSEFWRRWHISMSTFFRDYIYIPLGGSRVSKGRWVFNTLVVWGTTGLWHGAAWNFILWGIFYAIMLMIEKFFLGAILKKIPKFFGWLYMMFFTIIGFSFFMNDTNDPLKMFAYTLKLFGIGAYNDVGSVNIINLGIEANMVYLFVALLLAFPTRVLMGKLLDWFKTVKCKPINTTYFVMSDLVYVVTLVICIGFVIGGSYNPFIYFRF
ncbi:MAG: MBOAT family protein [Clostridia bacterium]|nr:MBOAT family protein [Clostridia bacterium]